MTLLLHIVLTSELLSEQLANQASCTFSQLKFTIMGFKSTFNQCLCKVGSQWSDQLGV